MMRKVPVYLKIPKECGQELLLLSGPAQQREQGLDETTRLWEDTTSFLGLKEDTESLKLHISSSCTLSVYDPVLCLPSPLLHPAVKTQGYF